MKVPTILGRVHMPAPFRSLFRPQALGATGRFSVRLLGLLVLTLSLPRLNPTSRLHGDVATRIADCQLTVCCAAQPSLLAACVQCIPCAQAATAAAFLSAALGCVVTLADWNNFQINIPISTFTSVCNVWHSSQ